MKIMERGQVTIPKEFRDKYGLKPGTELEFVSLNEGLLIIKKGVGKSLFRKVYGILNRKTSTDEYIEEIRGR